MNEIAIYTLGILTGCIISRYFIGLGNKMSINCQDGTTIHGNLWNAEDQRMGYPME
jgi:hypothetical protein